MKRLDLKIGYNCNCFCDFCAVGGRLNSGNNELSFLLRELREGYGRGCRYVVFTGGEPTIMNTLLDLVREAKGLGYSIIQLQTNARIFSHRRFAEKAVEAGANEFAPSLHGHSAAIHDTLVRSRRAYVQTVQGIKNAVDLGMYVAANSVISRFNYRTLPELVDVLCSLKVHQIQLAWPHPVGFAESNFFYTTPRYEEAISYIHRALLVGQEAGRKIMIEGVPYCFMQGYERFCSELYIPYTEIRGEGVESPDHETLRRTIQKEKFRQCASCRFSELCEGVWRVYPLHYGHDEFIPLLGRKLPRKKEVFAQLTSL